MTYIVDLSKNGTSKMPAGKVGVYTHDSNGTVVGSPIVDNGNGKVSIAIPMKFRQTISTQAYTFRIDGNIIQ